MNILRQYIRYSLSEKALRGQKDKRTLYHINFRPARPQPKVKMMQQWDAQARDRFGEEGDFVNVPETDNWQRYWLDSPVKSGVFLTPNPLDVAMNHGRSGNVYAYKVPEWVIDKSGGMHRYDTGSEVLIPEDVWNEAGDEIEFLGKTMEQKELWDKMDSSMFGRGHHRKPKKPSWMTDEELKQWEADVASSFNLSGLRSTKHPEAAIKMMKPDEVNRALAALEKKYPQEGPSELERGPRDKKGIVVPFFGQQPDKKDEELIAMLKKRRDESVVRSYVREMLLTEISLGLSHGTIAYTALVLDQASHAKLAALAPEGWKVFSHHMTIINPPNQKRRLPGRWLGQEMCVKVVGIAQDRMVMTAIVDLEGVPLPMKGPEYPHVTIATNPAEGGKPSFSNWKFKPVFDEHNFEAIDPITVCGTIEEILS